MSLQTINIDKPYITCVHCSHRQKLLSGYNYCFVSHYECYNIMITEGL